MANSADPDQLASSEASWTGSTLFAKIGYILVQQDKGQDTLYWTFLLRNQKWKCFSEAKTKPVLTCLWK